MSDVDPQIRIDFLQHAGSAMLRASQVPALSSDAAGATAEATAGATDRPAGR